MTNFIEQIKHSVRDGHCVNISFLKTKRIFADATLLFYAEMDRLRRSTNRTDFVTCSCPTNHIVRQALQHVGALRLLGRKEVIAVDHQSVKHWHRASGNSVDGEKIQKVTDFFEGSIAESLRRNPLYDGLIEAMANCSHHAYPEIDGDSEPPDRRWWMFSEELEGELHVAFCDLGVGIPATLSDNRKWEPETITRLLQALNLTATDGHLIRAAFEIRSSRTRKPNRGKGLQDIKQVLNSSGHGILRVLSSRGAYEYNVQSRSEQGIDSFKDFSDKIGGTLISWTIRRGANDGGTESKEH